MKSDQILNSDFLDLLFENRNQAYGAYVLRQQYGRRLKISVMVVTGLVAVFCLSNSFLKVDTPIVPGIPDPWFTKPAEIPQPQKPPVPPEVKRIYAGKKAAAVASEATVTQTRSAGNKIAFTSEDVPINTGSDPAATGAEGDSLAVAGNAVGIDSAFKEPENDIKEYVEKMPEFPGGAKALSAFLQRHLRMPDELASGSEVTVRVKFIVGFNGKLRGFEVLQKAGDIFDNEVLRVLQLMPDWIPGRAKDKEVAAYYLIPVRFVVPD